MLGIALAFGLALGRLLHVERTTGALACAAIKALARQGLVLTLFLIGTGLSWATLRVVCMRPLVQGVLLWLAVAGASLGAILLWGA